MHVRNTFTLSEIRKQKKLLPCDFKSQINFKVHIENRYIEKGLDF
jgi:hypothetical protein